MARVSDASRAGPEGGRSAASPLASGGSQGGLFKLIRYLSISIPFAISKSVSAFLGPSTEESKAYLSDRDAKGSLETGSSTGGA